ncbi:MAG: CoA transferase [Deltaproteobacteria bacterium]|jgi:crotonobetainyl-CoA:carnitine CoA-transferase CaiB-like acyl-CoA transferase|nr:CoA transferase [Deltaproteobacteria bacterium]
MPAPLSEIRVLELSRILAGPWAAQTLADLGASVIKVERPGSGDDTRSWGPPFTTRAADDAGAPTGDAAYFLCANRGKRSVTIDFTRPEGQKLVRALARQSDVVIENFKVGGLEKYGLDYASLRADNPGLVYCSITGFGQTGPYRERPGYDFLIQGMSGLMSITGEPDSAPGGKPVKVGVAVTDVLTGLYAVIAIQGALAHRANTGMGQQIDISLLDVQAAALANQALNYLVSGRAPGRLGNAHPNIVPYEAFQTSDGYIILAVGNDSQFARFCEIAGRRELADDERFASNPRRVENRNRLIPVLGDLIRARSSADWLGALERAGVPCGPINDIEQLFADPQVKARGLRISIPDPTAPDDGVAQPGVASPIHFSETPIRYELPPPRLGQHTDEVLRELLELDADERKRLRDSGVIGD